MQGISYSSKINNNENWWIDEPLDDEESTNIKIYDFAGVAPHPANSKESGIRNYKEKWGGDYIEYGIWGKSLSYKYNIWMLLRKLKNIVYRLFRK